MSKPILKKISSVKSIVPKPKKLSNGLKYLIVPTSSQSVSVSVLIKTGSAYELQKENGIAHFLEHMMFKGTKKRLTAKDIAIDFEKIGAINNAFTSHTTTGYWAKSQKDHAHTILEILADIYNNAEFRSVDMEKEKGVVLQEMAMYEDIPQEKVHMMMDELMYPDQPFGRSILGTKETVTSFTEKQLRDFYTTHYTRDRTWVIVSGGVDADLIEKDIKKFFSHKTSGTQKKVTQLAEPKPKKGTHRTSVLQKKTDQVHMIMSTHVGGYEDPDRYVYDLLATILGRGMSSRLFIKMREELGICYYAYAHYSVHTDYAGQFSIHTGVDANRVDVALEALKKECHMLATELVPQDELDKAKQMIKASLAMSMETAEDIATFYASQYIRKGKVLTIEQLYKKIDVVTCADIKRVAKKVFVAKNTYLAAIGEKVSDIHLI
jgi:predicted Zn-dependent peptidase